ncbi:50S ribosomal protein L30 [Candidatus Pacearchaeota archaeon]|nr:50S ribosomal protein L30 [Candidatus Pacearchaeota archaeon]
MILAIRISGQVKLSHDIVEALYRMRLRKKYSAVLLKPTKENLSLLRKLRDYIAYGDINKETLLDLIKSRGQSMEKSKKINAEKIYEELGEKSLEDLGLKPFFRLHPPRGGIDSKKHFGVARGVLGDNKDKINDLVRRML